MGLSGKRGFRRYKDVRDATDIEETNDSNEHRPQHGRGQRARRGPFGPVPIGGAEEAKLLALTSVPAPPGAPTDHERWALIDMTCQVLIAGTGTSGVTFIFPTSTGEDGYETRVLAEVAAFRFDPALDNGGWHDSTEFPAAYDNPLNGNLYKPIYFSNGQAIHGANNVPPQPASKGCTRLRVDHQDRLVAWLGLGDADGPVWSTSRINLTVSTQGIYLPDP